MMSLTQTYLHSFRLNIKYWYTAVIDAVTVTVITLLLLAFGKLLETRAYAISGGRGTEELKAWLLSASVETSQAFLQNIKSFTYTFIIGTVLVIALVIMIYSLSQKLVWGALLNVPFSWKRYWRWNWLTAILGILLLVYLLLYIIVQTLFNVIPWEGTSYLLATKMLSFLFILFFFLFLFLVFYSFTHSNKVFESIGTAFHLLKLHWSKLWRMFLLVLLTGLVLNLLLSFLQRFFLAASLFRSTPQLFTLLSAVVFLLFLAWLRVYVVQTVSAPG